MACSEARTTDDEASFCRALTGLDEGTLLDEKYAIEGVLGVGGMGVVLAATHVDLDRPVAIKVLRQELAREERIVARLLREGRAAASIHSQHVAAVIDVGRLSSGAPYVVMERLEGVGLDRLSSREGPLSLADAVDAIVETCEALAEAHAAGIVHRDLKPANLFLTRGSDGSQLIKLLDFGISKNLGEARRRSSALTDPHLALGSPNYMAPEQIKAADDVDPRADIWALGAILYELLSGRQAFDAADSDVLQAKILLEEHVPLRAMRPDVPAALERVVRRCLMKNRAARYAGVQALARDLAPYGSERARMALASITRMALLRRDSAPPSCVFTAPAPRERRLNALGRIAGWASVALALLFVAGFLIVSLALPAPPELRPVASHVRSSIARAQRFADAPSAAGHEPQIVPAVGVEEHRPSTEPAPRRDAAVPSSTMPAPRRVYGWTPGAP